MVDVSVLLHHIGISNIKRLLVNLSSGDRGHLFDPVANEP